MEDRPAGPGFRRNDGPREQTRLAWLVLSQRPDTNGMNRNTCGPADTNHGRLNEARQDVERQTGGEMHLVSGLGRLNGLGVLTRRHGFSAETSLQRFQCFVVCKGAEGGVWGRAHDERGTWREAKNKV
jgi:hypothetical protein